MTEKLLWHWTAKQFTKGDHLERIESPTSPGVPDVNFAFEHAFEKRATEGWIELKKSRKPTCKRPFAGKGYGLRPSQIIWFRKREVVFGLRNTWILAQVDTEVFLIPGLYYRAFNTYTISELRSKFICVKNPQENLRSRLSEGFCLKERVFRVKEEGWYKEHADIN